MRPYDQSLRDELHRELDALGVELRLGTALAELPSVPPATLAPIAIATANGGELVADMGTDRFAALFDSAPRATSTRRDAQGRALGLPRDAKGAA
jgi:hypothetical protein